MLANCFLFFCRDFALFISRFQLPNTKFEQGPLPILWGELCYLYSFTLILNEFMLTNVAFNMIQCSLLICFNYYFSIYIFCTIVYQFFLLFVFCYTVISIVIILPCIFFCVLQCLIICSPIWFLINFHKLSEHNFFIETLAFL